MTKEDIVKLLEPFTNDIEILIRDGERFFEVDHHAYGVSKTGDGVIVLQLGAQRIWPGITVGKATDT